MKAQRWNQHGKVIIHSETIDDPITLCGQLAGICYDSNTNNREDNFRRGLDCLASGHGRALENAQIYMILNGWSAKVMREFYTHIGGAPTRLQSSTRYIDYSQFDFIIPHSIEANEEARDIYNNAMHSIMDSLDELKSLGIPKEDSSMLLPFGMTTKVVVRTNLRNLIDMAKTRMCKRAYWEFRELFKEIIDSLKIYSDEWKTLIEEYNIFAPKCVWQGYCDEKKSCGAKPTKKEFMEWVYMGKSFQEIKNRVKEVTKET